MSNISTCHNSSISIAFMLCTIIDDYCQLEKWEENKTIKNKEIRNNSKLKREENKNVALILINYLDWDD